MLSCLRGRRSSRLVASMRSARLISRRVSLGLDHRVHVAPLGRHVGVEQAGRVVGLERGPLLRCGPALQDGGGLPGAHDRQLRRRPREADVVPHALGVHDDVRAAVALAQDHADPGHRRPPVGEHQLRAVADHAPPLQVLAGVEARRVDEGDDRQVERVAERDEAGALLRGGDVERAGDGQRLVGEDADRASVDRGEGRDQVRRPAAPELEHDAVVDDRRHHVAHVVAAGRRRGQELARLRGRDGRAGRRWASAAAPRRCATAGRPSSSRDGQLGGLLVGDDERRRAALAGVRGRPAELVVVDGHARELGHHRRAGEERVRRRGHDDEVGQPEEQRRAGDRGTVHDHDHRHDARALGDGLGGLAPAVQGGHALDDVGPARRDVRDEGQALVLGRAGGLGQGAGRGGGQRPAPLRGVHAHDDDRAVVEDLDHGLHRAGRPGPQRHVDHRRRLLRSPRPRPRPGPPLRRRGRARPVGRVLARAGVAGETDPRQIPAVWRPARRSRPGRFWRGLVPLVRRIRARPRG